MPLTLSRQDKLSHEVACHNWWNGVTTLYRYSYMIGHMEYVLQFSVKHWQSKHWQFFEIFSKFLKNKFYIYYKNIDKTKWTRRQNRFLFVVRIVTTKFFNSLYDIHEKFSSAPGELLYTSPHYVSWLRNVNGLIMSELHSFSILVLWFSFLSIWRDFNLIIVAPGKIRQP